PGPSSISLLTFFNGTAREGRPAFITEDPDLEDLCMFEKAMDRRLVQGFLFDMGDVLYDATAWRRWLLQLLSRMGLHAQYRTLFRIWDDEFLADVHRGRREYTEAFQSFLLSIGLSRAQIDEVQAASQARKRDLEAHVRPLPGVRSTIERLAARG